METSLVGIFTDTKYYETITKYANDGWRLVQVLPTNYNGHGKPEYYEIIVERQLKESQLLIPLDTTGKYKITYVIICYNYVDEGVDIMLDENKPFSHSADPYGSKANFDVNEKKLHSQGISGLFRQITNLLILVGILALIVILVRIF